jgi:hypothetical protein
MDDLYAQHENWPSIVTLQTPEEGTETPYSYGLCVQSQLQINQGLGAELREAEHTLQVRNYGMAEYHQSM